MDGLTRDKCSKHCMQVFPRTRSSATRVRLAPSDERFRARVKVASRRRVDGGIIITTKRSVRRGASGSAARPDAREARERAAGKTPRRRRASLFFSFFSCFSFFPEITLGAPSFGLRLVSVTAARRPPRRLPSSPAHSRRCPGRRKRGPSRPWPRPWPAAR